MTALRSDFLEEIRNNRDAILARTTELDGARAVTAIYVMEIAAQLAEINDHLRRIIELRDRG